jgi:Carboxypeptidase regulatory-like domain/2-keto-3-deoxygluconate permease
MAFDRLSISPCCANSAPRQADLLIPQTRRRLCGWKTLALLLALIASSPATFLWAQSFGSISGTVTDSSGANVPGALVTATQTKTGRKTTVNANDVGAYVFPAMAPEQYTISASARGFQQYVQTGVILQANQAATVNIVLQVGAVTETVNVEANAVQVDTTTGTLSQVIVSAIALIAVDRLVGGDGTAGVAAASTAGNAAAVPTLVGIVNPSYAPSAASATVLVAACVIVSSLLVPPFTALWKSHARRDAEGKPNPNPRAEIDAKTSHSR